MLECETAGLAQAPARSRDLAQAPAASLSAPKGISPMSGYIEFMAAGKAGHEARRVLADTAMATRGSVDPYESLSEGQYHALSHEAARCAMGPFVPREEPADHAFDMAARGILEALGFV